jgi:hypothetical protein
VHIYIFQLKDFQTRRHCCLDPIPDLLEGDFLFQPCVQKLALTGETHRQGTGKV